LLERMSWEGRVLRGEVERRGCGDKAIELGRARYGTGAAMQRRGPIH
jgi:hypothetical protein